VKRRDFLRFSTALAAQLAIGHALARENVDAASHTALSADPVAPPAAPQPDHGSAALRERVQGLGTSVAPGTREALATFYGEREFAPLLTRSGRWTDAARGLIARLAAAAEDGLDPSDYRRPSFAKLAESQVSPEEAAAAEVELASAITSYARHAVRGRVDTRRLAPLVFVTPNEVDLVGVMRDVAVRPEPARVLDGLNPPHAGFVALKRALAEAMTPQAASNEPARPAPIANGPIIRLGSADPRVQALRERFAITAPDGARPEVMDAALVAAVREFQRQNGLPMSGAVGAGTILALNGGPQPVEATREQRIAALLVNMERWRWLPRDLGERHLWVNIPEYLVKVMEGGQPIFTTRTVVGRPETPTPVFSNMVQYFVVNPSWNVPPGIAQRDFIPLLNNPEALARRGIEVVRRGRNTFFRQPPGARNALGRIKFMFPNPHAIYMHDTPARSYFRQARRLYSNGCIRVEEPLRFAEMAFSREGDVSARRIEAMYGDNERYVRLRHRVPVHLAYFTLEFGEDGRATRFEDVYGLDRRMRGLMGLA
jgi:murein L,D-transpeptidase YcbB/YkuD